MTSPDAVHDDDGLAGKACFDDIYTRDDPLAYYAALHPLDYQIPQHAAQVVHSLLRHRTGPETILDLCCSYGVNTALFAHDLTLDDLFDHYEAADDTAPRAELIAHDRAFFAAHRRPDAPRTIGLDQSAPAIAYACAVGQLDAGFAEDLEANEPSAELRAAVAGATMITVSGGVGYIGYRTFERVVSAAAQLPWVVALVLREVSYEPIIETLDGFGLVTERLPHRTFRQRRFADAEESQAALKRIDALGLSPAGKEDTGYYHAELFVSRPADQADRRLVELLDLSD
ncbi:MAG TPA: hypothetical protein VKB55_00255 [Nocardioidaceae bacterium]|nr:hypothetical protein [Nocardioidaceae bacterium]